MTTSGTKAITGSTFINRLGYSLFVLIGVYFLVFSEDKMNGISQLGIALIFDPFDPQVSFSKRPMYQKIWLITHLTITLTGFFWVIFK